MQSPAPATPVFRRVALLFAALVAVLTLAPSASAAKLTYSVGAGASVTLSDTPNPADASPGDAFAPGARIYVQGTGFVGTGGSGLPQICIKLNDVDGELTYDNNTPEFEVGLPTFQSDAGGTFSGWVQTKSSIPLTGPGAGGKHWLRILSGVPSSGTNVTVPISYMAAFRVQPDLEFGFTNTAGNYFPGSTIGTGPLSVPNPDGTDPSKPAPGLPGAVTLVGAPGKLDASESVAVTLDGTPLATTRNAGTTNPLTSNADGSFRAWVNLPPTAAGDHVLRVATSTKNEEITLKTVPHAATLQTPNVRPGGTAVVTGTGFLGIDGKPQKVALVGYDPQKNPGTPNDAILACGEADATGALTLVATIHPNATPGSATDPTPANRPILRVAAGTNCVPPVASQPLPRFIPAVGLSISTTAPQAGTTFTKASVGVNFPVTGAGFAAGESVQVKIDGVNAGEPLKANDAGALTGNVAVPAAAALGRKVLTFVGATSTVAADTVEAIAAPSVTIKNAGPVAIGQPLQISLKGFVRGVAREDGTSGQRVALRLDGGRDILGCISTDNDGNGDGELVIPAGTADGEHTLQVLAGSACVSGTGTDAPSRSLPTKFQVLTPVVEQPKDQPKEQPKAEQPKVDAPKGPAGQRPGTLKRSGTSKLTLNLEAGQATKVTITVKTKSKTTVSGKGKKKFVTIVKSTTVRPTVGKARKVTLTLTADGKKLLKRLKAIKVEITVDPDGTGDTTSRTITLRR